MSAQDGCLHTGCISHVAVVAEGEEGRARKRGLEGGAGAGFDRRRRGMGVLRGGGEEEVYVKEKQ